MFWDKLKIFFSKWFYDENNKPSLTRVFLSLSFIFAWVALFFCMFLVIQNADKIISALSTIITSIIGLKSLQAGLTSVMNSVYNSKQGEKPT